MKFLIVLACLLAIAYAGHEDTKVLHNDAEVLVDSFKYAYELDNHIRANQQGQLHDKDNWLVSGEYEYVSPEGKNIKVTYKADEHGYHPTVHHV